LLQQCDAHIAHVGDNYLPFLWHIYKTYRVALLRILQVIQLRSTSQDTALEAAIAFLLSHQTSRRPWLDTSPIQDEGTPHEQRVPLLDLSWIPPAWWRLVTGQRSRDVYPARIDRRQFEVCLFSQLMWELKSGDLFVEGSDVFADYRPQLVSLEEYQARVAEYGQRVGLPLESSAFVAHVQTMLETTASQTDQAFPSNQHVHLEKGMPIIHRPARQAAPDELTGLERLLEERLDPINVVDVLADTEHWLNWTRFFGPLSGHDTKLANPVERYLTTVFCYGCSLGPSQTARALGYLDRRQIAWPHQHHITADTLDEAIRWVINAYNRFPLPKIWGSGKHASADGTKWDIYEQNLLAEYHIRYGGYGGIGYYHVSDTYIALFSHFIPCGVWEGIYILDPLFNNPPDIHPDTLHADTQGQSEPIFGLAYLLGIRLMPRIRNWQDLNFYRPHPGIHYEHIDALFTQTIDWQLIATHLPDMLRVALSIQAGRITASAILRRLGTYSRKNRLYRAFRELGRAVRTGFLLDYLNDVELRTLIREATNKSESFNGFTKWLSFGGDQTILANDRDEQRKLIKYNHLVANCLIFYNVFAISRILHERVQTGEPLAPEVVAALSPYWTHHINRFGRYHLDLTRHPPAIDYEVPVVTQNAHNSPHDPGFRATSL
jgi:TnpA family transposase